VRATFLYGAGDVRIEDVPDPRIVESTDAVLRVTRACICGSDLWPYRSMQPSEKGQRMGHEAIGVLEAVGRHVRTVRRGGPGPVRGYIKDVIPTFAKVAYTQAACSTASWTSKECPTGIAI
jgi:threonine dehydrogenase-like Zn-dependent dehydrogenase